MPARFLDFSGGRSPPGLRRMETFRELCRKAALEDHVDKLEIIKEQMKILLSNDEPDVDKRPMSIV